MNSRVFWQSDWPLSHAARALFQRSARFSQHFLSAVGLVAVTSLLALWLRPQWRDPFAARLLPFFAVTSELSPAFDSQQNQNLESTPSASSAEYAPTLLPTQLSLSTLVRSMSSERIDAAARDDRVLASQHDQALIARYLARRYRVAHRPMQHIVRVAFETGRETGLDPLLLLSIIAVESSFNPFAENASGAQGLMQVISTLHADKFSHFGGIPSALEPFANIKVGAIVLRNYIASTGSLAGGLRRYVGSTARGDGGYGARVLSERTRLQEIVYAQAPSRHLTAQSRAPKARKVTRLAGRSQTMNKVVPTNS